MVGYLHNLSPIKTSQNKNQYFSLNFQTNSQVYRAVCFSPEKHSVLKRKLESSSPVNFGVPYLKCNLGCIINDNKRGTNSTFIQKIRHYIVTIQESNFVFTSLGHALQHFPHIEMRNILRTHHLNSSFSAASRQIHFDCL